MAVVPLIEAFLISTSFFSDYRKTAWGFGSSVGLGLVVVTCQCCVEYSDLDER